MQCATRVDTEWSLSARHRDSVLTIRAGSRSTAGDRGAGSRIGPRPSHRRDHRVRRHASADACAAVTSCDGEIGIGWRPRVRAWGDCLSMLRSHSRPSLRRGCHRVTTTETWRARGRVDVTPSRIFSCPNDRCSAALPSPTRQNDVENSAGRPTAGSRYANRVPKSVSCEITIRSVLIAWAMISSSDAVCGRRLERGLRRDRHRSGSTVIRSNLDSMQRPCSPPLVQPAHRRDATKDGTRRPRRHCGQHHRQRGTAATGP